MRHADRNEDRIYRFPDRLIGMRQGRVGSFIEQAMLATDGSDILHQFFDDTAFRHHRDFVNHLDEQIHQTVNDFLPPFPAKDGYQRRALRLRMSTDFSPRFLTPTVCPSHDSANILSYQ